VQVQPVAGPYDRLPAVFRRLLVAWAGSLTGDGLRVIALPLLAASIDPSAAAVAVVAVAATLPWLLVAIPAGALVDRLDPAKVMATAHIARAVATIVLTVLVLAGSVSIAELAVFGFVITSAETFADGSAQSLVVKLVPSPLLERANARFVTVETVALDMAGPLAAGVLFSLSSWLPFAVSAVCFLVAAVTVATIRMPARGPATATSSVEFVPPEVAPPGVVLPSASLGEPRSPDAEPGDAAPSDRSSHEAGSAEAVSPGAVSPDAVSPDDVSPQAMSGETSGPGAAARDPRSMAGPPAETAGSAAADPVTGLGTGDASGHGRPPSASEPVGGRKDGALFQIKQGLHRLVTDPVLRVLVITVAIMVIANAATDAVLVLYGTQTLGMSEAAYPLLLVAYSIGTLIAAALVARSNSRLRGGQTMMMALFGISATMLVLGLFPVVGVALAAYAVMGLAGGTWNVLSATRRQRRTPRTMIARVSSAFRVVAWGVMPVGAALGGVVGERWGVTAVFVLAGAVIAVLGLVVVRSFVAEEPAAVAAAG
jgi:MFS family permease